MNPNLLAEVEREKAETGRCFKAVPAAALSP